MHRASRGHAGGASATVGMGVPEVPGGRPVDPTALPVPLPPLRPDRPVVPDVDVRPASHPVSVPSLTREFASQSQQRPRVCGGQAASQATQEPVSVSLKATVGERRSSRTEGRRLPTSAIGRLAGSGQKGLAHEEAGRCGRPAARRQPKIRARRNPCQRWPRSPPQRPQRPRRPQPPGQPPPGPSGWWLASIAPRCTRPDGPLRRHAPTTRTTGSRHTWTPMATASPAKRCTEKSEGQDRHRCHRTIATPPTRMSACRRPLLTLTAPTLANELRLTTATATHTAWTPIATGLGATATANRSLELGNRCATSVPFTAVLTGPQRTPTDNTPASSTCAVPSLRRWRTPPIWLCKQEVASSRLRSGSLLGRADRSSIGEDPKATHGGNVIGRALASSACRST
jgi:hypothetical protein